MDKKQSSMTKRFIFTLLTLSICSLDSYGKGSGCAGALSGVLEHNFLKKDVRDLRATIGWRKNVLLEEAPENVGYGRDFARYEVFVGELADSFGSVVKESPFQAVFKTASGRMKDDPTLVNYRQEQALHDLNLLRDIVLRSVHEEGGELSDVFSIIAASVKYGVPKDRLRVALVSDRLSSSQDKEVRDTTWLFKDGENGLYWEVRLSYETRR